MGRQIGRGDLIAQQRQNAARSASGRWAGGEGRSGQPVEAIPQRRGQGPAALLAGLCLLPSSELSWRVASGKGGALLLIL